MRRDRSRPLAITALYGVSARQSTISRPGRIISAFIEKERAGDISARRLQVIPHVTNEIKDFVLSDPGEDVEFRALSEESAATVGDIEACPSSKRSPARPGTGPDRACLSFHLTASALHSAAGEMKTKPTQPLGQELRSIGISRKSSLAAVTGRFFRNRKRQRSPSFL